MYKRGVFLQEKGSISRTNRFCVDNREKASFSGIVDVLEFSENSVVLLSDLGEITIKGNQLKVVSFSNETGDFEITGRIDIVGYTDDAKPSKSVFSKLLR